MAWDAEKRCLTGRSQMIAGHPYRLRFAVPNGWHPLDKSLVALGGESYEYHFDPKESGSMNWEVTFADRDNLRLNRHLLRSG